MLEIVWLILLICLFVWIFIAMYEGGGWEGVMFLMMVLIFIIISYALAIEHEKSKEVKEVKECSTVIEEVINEKV